MATLKEANEKYIVDEEIEFLGAAVGYNFVEPARQVAGYDTMKIQLLSFPDYQRWVDSALWASLATWDTTPHEPVTKMLNASFKEKEQRLLYMLSKRPISVALEGAVFTFKCTGIPRAMTHQIVRARAMSFGQQSFRVSSCYADPIRVPQTLLDDYQKNANPEGEPAKLYNQYVETVKACRKTYKDLIQAGIPMEQARCIMPMGTCTKIAVTMRLRDMIDYFKGRTSDITQDEHTYLVCLMAKEVKSVCPEFFKLVASRCPGLEKQMKEYLGA